MNSRIFIRITNNWWDFGLLLSRREHVGYVAVEWTCYS